MPKSLGNIYSQDVPTGRPGTSLYDVLQSFSKCSNWIYRPLVGLNDQWWCIITISGIYCWCWRCRLPIRNKSDRRVLKKISSKSYKKISIQISQKYWIINNPLHWIQAIMWHTGDILRNKSDRRVLKKYQGRPYKTSCNSCNSFKQIDISKSLKNIEFYTIQAVICHLCAISRNKSDHRVLKNSQGRSYETSCNIFCNSF